MGPIGRVALVKHMKNKGSIKYIFSWFKNFMNDHSTLQLDLLRLLTVNATTFKLDAVDSIGIYNKV